jgi:hypothetical protein
MRIIFTSAVIVFFGFVGMDASAQEKPSAGNNASDGVNKVEVKGPHQLSVTQTGQGNTVSVDQKGGKTMVKGYQNVTIVTSENGNTITSKMDSDTASAKSNVIHVRQSGSGNRSTIIQSGSGNRSTVNQSPSGKQNN